MKKRRKKKMSLKVRKYLADLKWVKSRDGVLTRDQHKKIRKYHGV